MRRAIAPLLTRSMLAHAGQHALAALSIATRQEIAGLGEGLLHPALLTTLVYRFGLPGNASRAPREVQANGQCFLVRRDVCWSKPAPSPPRVPRAAKT